MATEETKNKMGGILFNMVALVAGEMNQQMAFPGWQQADAETRTAYLRVVDQLLATLEADQPVVTDVDIERAEANLTAQPVFSTTIEPPLTHREASDLLATILAEDSAHPVTLSQMPPKDIVKEKRQAQAAKAREAKRLKKELQVAAT